MARIKRILRSMLCSLKGRDEQGYPTEDVDIVPERKTPDVLSTVVHLLQEANQRNERLKDEKGYWYK